MQGIANFFSIVPSPMILMDAQGIIVLANEHTCSMFGYEPGALMGKTVADLMPELYRGAHAKHLEEYFRSPCVREMGIGLEVKGLRADGAEFLIEVSLNPYAEGDTVYTLASMRAITERKTTESRIRHLNRVLAMQGRINALIVRVHDRDELLREACRIIVETGAYAMAWVGLLDTDGAEIQIAASFGEHAEDYLRDIEIETPLESGPMSVSIRENRPVWIQSYRQTPLTAPWHERTAQFGYHSAATLPLHRGEVTIGAIALYADETSVFDEEETKLLTDVASNMSFAMDHLEKETMLKRLIDYDGLTGLGNRTWFMGRVTHYLRKAAREGHKLAVLQFDLERFKNINDTLGHAAGDQVLKQVAKWLKDEVGHTNLLARLDVDHFAVMIPQVEHVADVELLVERWMSALRDQVFGLREDTFRISAKVGISMYPEDGVKAGMLFNHAEAALKQAKASRNRYLFHTRKMSEMMAGKFVLENQLRRALDREEFVLHYQPKVDVVSGELSGAEALIRWNDPHTGLVQPNRFIPMLEETGLICEVGRWALGKTLEDALRWRQKNAASVRIAVNVSPLQLRNRQFLHEIEYALASHPDAAASLELEVTEGMIMEDVEYSIDVLRAIRAMGVTIALDDFGTGFSSLSYLSKLPLDTLKIDRSFVFDLNTAPERLSQISAIVNLAHSMHLKVVAEGVETEDQSRLLHMLGCDEMQGFLFSRPLPCSVFESRYLAKRADLLQLPLLHPWGADHAAG